MGQFEKLIHYQYQRLAIRYVNRGPARGSRRARFWRGGVPTDVHRVAMNLGSK